MDPLSIVKKPVLEMIAASMGVKIEIYTIYCWDHILSAKMIYIAIQTNTYEIFETPPSSKLTGFNENCYGFFH